MTGGMGPASVALDVLRRSGIQASDPGALVTESISALPPHLDAAVKVACALFTDAALRQLGREDRARFAPLVATCFAAGYAVGRQHQAFRATVPESGTGHWARAAKLLERVRDLGVGTIGETMGPTARAARADLQAAAVKAAPPRCPPAKASEIAGRSFTTGVALAVAQADLGSSAKGS